MGAALGAALGAAGLRAGTLACTPTAILRAALYLMLASRLADSVAGKQSEDCCNGRDSSTPHLDDVVVLARQVACRVCVALAIPGCPLLLALGLHARCCSADLCMPSMVRCPFAVSSGKHQQAVRRRLPLMVQQTAAGPLSSARSPQQPWPCQCALPQPCAAWQPAHCCPPPLAHSWPAGEDRSSRQRCFTMQSCAARPSRSQVCSP